MSSRATMSPQRWASLSAFPWADKAKAQWDTLTDHQRRVIVAAARAEQAADVAYNRADRAMERVKWNR